jgi:polysaccharide biosynthesis protein PslH
MGSGTRLKVLEGLAMGKAIVSTTLGCEGIDVQHQQHLLIADDPDDFARHVLRLLDDAALATRLGRQGRALMEAEYDWAPLVQRLEQFYGTVLGSVQPRTAAVRGGTEVVAPSVRAALTPAGGED